MCLPKTRFRQTDTNVVKQGISSIVAMVNKALYAEAGCDILR